MATIINRFGKVAGWNSITVNLLGRDVEVSRRLNTATRSRRRIFVVQGLTLSVVERATMRRKHLLPCNTRKQ